MLFRSPVDVPESEKAAAEKEAKQAEPEHQAEDMETEAGESQEAPQEKEHVTGRFSNGRID